MCQLLGMNCSQRTDFRKHTNFRDFVRRGGDTDVHSHGWGICIYEEEERNKDDEQEQHDDDASTATSSYGGGVLRSFHDTSPACESPIAEVLNNQIYPMQTYNMMAHIRYATKGCVSIENVHPFTRELWGIQWCFAHNGDIPTTTPTALLGNTNTTKKQDTIIYHPMGDTDSEAIFCIILNALNTNFNELPTQSVLYKFLYQLCNRIVHDNTTTSTKAIFNFLLSCGQYTSFAYSWPGKRPGSKVWNGLYYILREVLPAAADSNIIDCCDDDTSVGNSSNSKNIAVVTTKPLTNENNWIEFQKDELIMFHKGLPYFEAESCDIVKQQQGRVLQQSKCFERRRKQQQQTLPSPLCQEQ